MFTRRGLLPVAAAGLLLPLSRGRAAGLVPFKVGQSAPANTFLAIWMAADAGFYKAQGLDESVLKMAGGRDAGPKLSSGAIQAMHIGMSSIVRADAKGADLKIVGSLSNVIRFTLFTRPGVKAADLKGAVVGISSFGSESDVTLALALRKIGLSRKDVTVKEVGIDPKRIAALQAGTIQATMLNEPARSHALAMGLNPLVDMVKDQVPWIFTGLAADGAYVRQHRGNLISFLKATMEGNYLSFADEARAKAVLAKGTGITDPKIIDISYDDFRKQSPPDLEVSTQGAENVISLVAPGHPVSDYVDPSLLAEIKASGFVEGLKKKYGSPS